VQQRELGRYELPDGEQRIVVGQRIGGHVAVKDIPAHHEGRVILGERILSAAAALRPVARLVRSSHERWDGQGYPDGLRETAIPRGARIIAVCDAYEAMTADRPYRRALSRETADSDAGQPTDPPLQALADRVRCLLSQPAGS
jgi:hypothetical protein